LSFWNLKSSFSLACPFHVFFWISQFQIMRLGNPSLVATALLCLTVGALAATLVDQQINSDLPDSSAFYLDGLNWQLSGPAIHGGASPIPARVPGEVITDLQLNGLISDPFLDNTFLSNVWDATNFTYSIDFDLPATLSSGAEVVLVFDSVKMAAIVELNGVQLDTVSNQFVRFQYPVRRLLRATHNTLSLTFVPSADFRNLHSRFMSCSGTPSVHSIRSSSDHMPSIALRLRFSGVDFPVFTGVDFFHFDLLIGTCRRLGLGSVWHYLCQRRSHVQQGHRAVCLPAAGQPVEHVVPQIVYTGQVRRDVLKYHLANLQHIIYI
jgi:hypothetical protein